MKFRILTLLSLLFFVSVLQAQWSPRSGGSGSLYSVQFPSASIGYIAGDFGSMIKSTDGGESWTGQTSGVPDDLYCVFFLNANVGFACGDNGSIIKTTDAGNQWNVLTTGTPSLLTSVFFVNTSLGYAAGMSGTILKTTNGGATWVNTGTAISENYFAIAFTSTTDGVVSGFGGIMRHTTNGGTSWTLVPTGSTHVLTGLHFADASVGFCVGDGNTILKTVNGGSGWTHITSGFAYDLIAVFCVDVNTVFTVGAQGTILKTTDGGVTWQSQNSGTGNLLQGVFFSNASLGWAVGQSATILKTTNGGLPVELASFTANAAGAGVELRWQTATETNNYGFSIERQNRMQPASWTTIGFVQGHGTTTGAKLYHFADNPATAGLYAYRLKQIDLDGKFEYSAEQLVNVGTAGTMLGQNYPNPVTMNTTISYALEREANVSLAVYDALGRRVSTLVESIQPSGAHTAVFHREKLAAGSYTYRLTVEGRTLTRQLFLN